MKLASADKYVRCYSPQDTPPRTIKTLSYQKNCFITQAFGIKTVMRVGVVTLCSFVTKTTLSQISQSTLKTEEARPSKMSISAHKTVCVASQNTTVGTATTQSTVLRSYSSSADLEVPRILWNINVHYRVHKRPPISFTLRQTKPV